MKRIYKYTIQTEDSQIIVLPKGYKILCCQVQAGIPCLWALVDDDATANNTTLIRTYGTGYPIDSELEQHYIGTYQLENGKLVFHVFEEKF